MDSLPDFSFPPSQPKMLIVDDQALNIRLLHELFQREFELYMATDGPQAISMVQELKPDLILLDVVMPGLDGFEVCRQLKEDPATRHIPIIFITGSFDENDEVRGFEIGASDFIHKPINPVITRARVNTHLALKQQADKLRSIALIDGLTLIANRHKFDDELVCSWRACQRSQVPLALMMIDVDYFKQFNDLYGHQLGDSCLQWVARTVKQTLRRSRDLVARYGGEEFACILPDTDLRGATVVAEQLLDAIQRLRLEHANSDVSKFVTASIGVAVQVPSTETTAQVLLTAADKQLYRAKQTGRARACLVDLDNG